MTQGEFIDKMTMDEIINHPQFFSLHIEKSLNGSPDYWKVTFESNKRNEANTAWVSLNGTDIFHKHFVYYKIKQ